MITRQTLDTTRFGTIEIEAEDILTFGEGMIGFPAQRQFVLLEHRPGSPFRWLQSVEEAALAFLVVDPAHYIADYAPEVNETQVSDLRMEENTPRLVYTVVNIPKGKPEEMTLNLAGPIVINVENRRAKQLVLEDSRYSLKHRVLPAGADTKAA